MPHSPLSIVKVVKGNKSLWGTSKTLKPGEEKSSIHKIMKEKQMLLFHTYLLDCKLVENSSVLDTSLIPSLVL